MKIAMMTNNYKPFIGGVPISIERLSEGLRERGHHVAVFAPTYKQQMVEKDVIRYRSLMEGPVGGIAIPNFLDPKIEKAFEEESFDVIHVHHPMMIGNTAAYLSKKYGIPLVFTYHTRYEQYLYYIKPMQYFKGVVPKYLKSFLSHCDFVFAPTQGMERYLIEECNQNAQKVAVLPTGLNQDSYKVDAEEVIKLQKRYKKENGNLFCSVSRLAHEKNIFFLLQCLAEYKKKAKNPFTMLLIGDGPNRKEYEEEAQRLGLQGEVVFTGKLNNQDIKNYCGASDLFLFASKTETQGIVILETMAAKTPVIAVKATGVEDLVKQGVNGYITTEDASQFAEKMLETLEDKEGLEILGNGAYEYAQLYRQEAVVDNALMYYEMTIKENRKTYYAPKIPVMI